MQFIKSWKLFLSRGMINCHHKVFKNPPKKQKTFEGKFFSFGLFWGCDPGPPTKRKAQTNPLCAEHLLFFLPSLGCSEPYFFLFLCFFIFSMKNQPEHVF